MSSDRRQLDRPLNEAEIASTSAAVPLDGATQAQIDKGREIAQALSANDLTVWITAIDGTLKELPIGDAVRVLNARKEITDEMATGLEVLWRTTLARLGKTEDEVRQACEDPTRQAPEAIGKITTYRSLLEAIQEAARETLPNATTGRQGKNPFYGSFTYSVDLGDGLTEVSILEAIAWLEHKGKLSPVNASRLRNACMEHMQRVTYRPSLRKKLTTEEVKQELADLGIKATEIVKPKEEVKGIKRLEKQLDDGDFTLYVEIPFEGQKERPFLEAIFYLKKDKKLSPETTLRLAKLCIDKMLQHGRTKESIKDTIYFMFMAHIITPEELSELINHLIPDRNEATRIIKDMVELESAEETPDVIIDDTGDGDVDIDVSGFADEGPSAVHDGPPVPAAYRDTREVEAGVLPTGDSGLFQEVHSSIIVDARPLNETPPAGTRLPTSSRISGYPEISRLITGRRLAFVAAGLLVIVAGGTAIVTSVNKRPNSAHADVQAGIASTETGGEPQIDPVKLAGEAEQDGTNPTPEQSRTREVATPAPRRAPAETATPAPAPNPTPPGLTGAPPLVSLRRPAQSITIPVTTKPAVVGGGFKIDTANEACKEWEKLGYRVIIAAGAYGKILKLTDERGNIYEIEIRRTVKDPVTTLTLPLRPTE